jgi:hypothetical protein
MNTDLVRRFENDRENLGDQLFGVTTAQMTHGFLRRTPDHDHGASSVPHTLLAHRTQHHPDKRTTTSAADDQQVCATRGLEQDSCLVPGG